MQVGGIDPRVGIANPPYERIADVCDGQSAALLRVAATAPRVVVAGVRREALGGGLTRLEVDVVNEGYLPTYVLSSARKLTWNTPLVAEVRCEDCELVATGTLVELVATGALVVTPGPSVALGRSDGPPETWPSVASTLAPGPAADTVPAV